MKFLCLYNLVALPQSPSVWRVWIEIVMLKLVASTSTSPSVWRVWIEIGSVCNLDLLLEVTLRVEGVD